MRTDILVGMMHCSALSGLSLLSQICENNIIILDELYPIYLYMLYVDLYYNIHLNTNTHETSLWYDI